METGGETVCVTGAGGFLAAWLVKLLLQRGYNVLGTVRDPGDPKNAHLKNLEGAKEGLKLLKADLLDYDSILAAIDGCTGVFHTACPVPSHRVANPEVEMVNPAVKGTSNVLKACSVAKVKRVIMTSSLAAVYENPNRPKDKLIDESCWSDPEYCKETQAWYFLSKTVSEQEAWHYSKESGLDLVTLCPSLILGPMLQPTINASSQILIKLMTGNIDTCENQVRNMIDVRDCAKAHLLAYETPAAGRYLCTAHTSRTKELVDILHRLYPQYNYPKDFVDVDASGLERISNSKIQDMGLEFRKLEETLVDTVECLQKRGILK
uniref:TSA: Wollemia nobilis Ref_Wollemi_Transcript_1433_1286 transcribed RNA sequence n=1 Tax=Wollemia nobilis TaxID=56998 RepID=A0A0C9S9B3_9CONI